MDTIFQFAPFLGEEEYTALRSCFEDNWITEGPKSTEFLSELKKLMNCPHACFAPNGTLALYLALKGAGIGPGDEVVVPDFTFFGSASCVEMCGATPVFCDIDPDTLQTRADLIESALTPKTKAIMPVHIYGMTCDMDPILELARERNLKVVEDAAQAVGVFYKGRHAGTLGDVGTFSFFADKTITTGEGGLIVTRDDQIHERLRYLRNQGRIDRGSFIHPEMGYNFRITDLQAAVGLVQLSKLEDIKKRKHQILATYRELLKDTPQVRFIKITPDSTYIPFRAALYAENAHQLMEHMSANKIQTRTFFYPLHRQPPFVESDMRGSGEKASDADFPGSVYAYDNGLCLPSYPALPDEHIHRVCETIKDFYA